MGRHMLFPGNFPTGNLSGGLAASGQPTFNVSGWGLAIGGAGQPFVVVINPLQSNEEKIACSQVTAGGVVTVDTRGWDGTTGVAHSSGEPVRIIWDATTAQDVDDHLYTTGRDDHAQYLNVTRHDITGRHGSTVVSHSLIGSLGNDDHTQYLNASRHDAHGHPAGAFLTGGSAVITRAMLAGAAQGLMIGQLVARPGGISGAEASYLIPADGSNVGRTTWPLLFVQYGTKYGAGDGSTTFGIPDCRDRVVIGSCATSPDGTRSARAEGATGGEETHTMLQAELVAHAHTITDSGHAHVVSDPGHTHNGIQGSGDTGATPGWPVVGNDGATIGLMASPTGGKAQFQAPAGVGTGSATTGVTTQTGHASTSATNTGGGAAFNVMQPWIAFPVFIVAG